MKAHEYDINGNRTIDMAEHIQALPDRAAERITKAELKEIVDAYLASAYG